MITATDLWIGDRYAVTRPAMIAAVDLSTEHRYAVARPAMSAAADLSTGDRYAVARPAMSAAAGLSIADHYATPGLRIAIGGTILLGIASAGRYWLQSPGDKPPSRASNAI